MRELLSKPKPKWYEWFILCLISFGALLYPTYLYLENSFTIKEMLGELGFGLSFILMMSSIMITIMIIFKVPTKQKDGNWK